MNYALALLMVSVSVSVYAGEWEGVASEDYWWPYNLYLALIWIGLPLYIFLGWLRRWWRERRDIQELHRQSTETSPRRR